MSMFFEYMNNKYGLDNLIAWITEWFVEQTWSLPEFFGSLPKEMLKSFEINAELYRTIVLDENDFPVSTSLCSWTEDYQVALEFTENNVYINLIEENGGVPVFHIYKYIGNGISLNKLIDELIHYIETNNIDVDIDELDHMKQRFEKYKYEKEFFAEFDLNKITLIEKL